MIWMPDFTFGIHMWVASHHLPGQPLGGSIMLDDLAILPFGQAVWIFRTDVDRRPTQQVKLLYQVRFAAAAADWLIGQNRERVVRFELWLRYKEPLALANKARISPFVPLFSFNPLSILR